jgi:chromosome segregation ATPase
LAAVPVLYAFLARIQAGDTDRAWVKARLDDLRIQLAHVESKIKRLLQELHSKRLEEMDVKDRIQAEEDQTAKLFRDLEKAAGAYTDLLQSISSMFAR